MIWTTPYKYYYYPQTISKEQQPPKPHFWPDYENHDDIKHEKNT